MNTDFDKAYDVLGVKPGVSVRELKAAHRDLAKVWHPDRFVHDPGLREKAQDKLKEINAAYELLSSGKPTGPRPAPPPTYAAQPPITRRQSAPRRSHGFGLILLMFIAVFAVTISILLQKPQNRAPAVEIATTNSEEVSPLADENRRRQQTVGSLHRAAPESTPAIPHVQPLPTVTVVIDAHTGLLATPYCPQPTRMTYRNGDEPQTYCNARHPRITATAIETEPKKTH